MRCPFCLNEVAAFRQETDTHSRPILICPDAACKAEGVPFQYAQEYEQYSPIPFSIVGLRGHGKTVFLTSLFHVFEQIGRPGQENALWPGAYYEPLDEENMHEVRDRLKGLAEGRLPPATSFAPSNVISPAQLLCRPTMQRASVVLPEPDSPTTATHDSGGTSSSIPDRTCVRP